MSTKRFCDYCGGLITNDRSHDGVYRDTTSLKRVDEVVRNKVTVVISVKSDLGEADICSYCVFAAVEKLDFRPKKADPEPEPKVLLTGGIGDCGGGVVEVFVGRDTGTYPAEGTQVAIVEAQS